MITFVVAQIVGMVFVHCDGGYRYPEKSSWRLARGVKFRRADTYSSRAACAAEMVARGHIVDPQGVAHHYEEVCLRDWTGRPGHGRGALAVFRYK